MNDVAWALNTARGVGPIPPPHAHAHPIHKAHLTHTGPLRSHVAGRTDHLPSQVPNGSFVLPADIVSALGEGNTEAGYKAVKHMFGSAKRHFDGLPYAGGNGPYGQSGGPYGMASGGSVDGHIGSYQGSWNESNPLKQYDKRYYDIVPDYLEDESGNVVGKRHKAVAKAPFRDRLDIDNDPDLMYRGMSHAEYEHFKKHGKIQSAGSHNFSSQSGLTYWTSDPRAAESYANSFAPRDNKPTWGKPAYVVAAKRADNHDTRHVNGVAEHELGVTRPIGHDEISAIYRGNVVHYDPGSKSVSPSARLNWEQIHPQATPMSTGGTPDGAVPVAVAGGEHVLAPGPYLVGHAKGGSVGKADPNEIPTRLITAKNSAYQGSPHVSMGAARQTPDAFSHNINLIRSYPGIPEEMKKLPDDQLAEAFTNHVKGNLLWLHDNIHPEIRERSKKWYDGANRIAQNWAKMYKIPVQSVAGILASLSPQKDWFQNVSLAKRVLDTMHGTGYPSNTGGKPWTPEMQKKLESIPALNREEFAPVHKHIFGKSIGEIDAMPIPDDEKAVAKAMWLRLHDEAHNSKDHPIVSPEGNFGAPVKTERGANAKIGWGSLNEIGKAIQAYQSGGDPNYLSRLMGERHKVRNFFNNILAPNSPHGHVTIDTHAVAAGLLRPLSGNSVEVSHNFATSPKASLRPADYVGARGSAKTGVHGLYPLYAEAYRRAAAERGILPREMQSITWEGVRGLFPEKFKTEANNAKINGLWSDYANGARNIHDTRNEILRASGGINPPDWFTPSTPNAPIRNPVNSQELRSASLNGGQAGSQGVYWRGGGVHEGRYQAFAVGGSPNGGYEPVPVAVAGGEHVLAPHEVEFAGMGDNEAGHKALTEFVLRQRAKLIKDLKGLAPPKND